MRRIIPRTMEVLGYTILIEKASTAAIKEETGENHEGFWLSMLDGQSKFAGRLMIDKGLSRYRQWKTLWHELEHALTDISDWDLEKRAWPEIEDGLCLDCGDKRKPKEAKSESPDDRPGDVEHG